MKELALPITDPVLIFAILLFIILLTPLLLNRLRIPHLIGMIIAGAAVGPHGLNLLHRDSAIVLFGTVGLLYIMFLAGLEIEIADFKKNSRSSLIFGFYTFSIPMFLGILAGYYWLRMPILSSVLLASMFASHTLIAYPIVSSFGVIRNQAVVVAIGGTMITDTMALLVLAAIVGVTSGTITEGFWLPAQLRHWQPRRARRKVWPSNASSAVSIMRPGTKSAFSFRSATVKMRQNWLISA